jgi:hypothetical protein
MTLSKSRNDLFSTATTDAHSPKPPPPLNLASPRTSSFFDVSTPLPRPAPVPRPLRIHIEAIHRTDRPAEPLSPLHQSPSLYPGDLSTSWQPPVPPRSDNIALRFFPKSIYLLGEGRYATVYLASYNNPNGNWQLCAAKQMAPDRESQTMGLREAFFLNRLGSADRSDSDSARQQRGSVYIVKLIAVKEDESRRNTVHSRSTSDALIRPSTRHRSSTLVLNEPALSSYPSLPALNLVGRPAPSSSRLMLLLEHAPLGTMDRLLRTSPALVGRELWSRWAIEATDALAWVHSKGVMHADVKPGNLLVSSIQDELTVAD